jgi:RND superfamily putative drug exporter
VHSKDADLAVRRGFTQGARVVTAAALIMLFVFASFIPEGSGVIKPIALSLASGILFDAFLIRMTLVPAVMLLFKRAAWYLPRWIDRILPTIDIEGEGLTVQRGDLAWAEGERRWALSSANLVPVVPFDAEPLSVHAERGGTTTVQVPAASRRVVVATLTGHLAAASGRVQVDGRVAPSNARELRIVAAPVFDDGTAWDASTRELVRERLRLAPRHYRRGSVNSWLERLPEGFGVDAVLGELRAEERLLALALAAAAGGATVLVVDAGDIGRPGEQRLAALLDLLVDGDRTAVLVVAAGDGPERAAIAPNDSLKKVTAS